MYHKMVRDAQISASESQQIDFDLRFSFLDSREHQNNYECFLDLVPIWYFFNKVPLWF